MELIKGIGGTSGGGGGSGTVTSVSVVSANGFAGTVATSTTTPAITLTTTVTGMLKGNGTAISGVTGTTNEIAYWSDANTIGSLTTATYPSLTELSYLKGVTSSIQTQLNAKGVGDVTKVGTPVNNQVGVWTGDGTIEGVNALQFDGTKLSISGVDSMTVNGSAITTHLQVHETDASGLAETALEIHKHTATAGAGASMYFARSRGTTGAESVVQSGDALALITGVGYDGTDYATAAQISFEVDGTPGSNDMPGRIVFSTSADGSQTLAEAVRITSAGNVGVGTTTVSARIHGIATTEQLRLGYDASNYASFTVASTGLLTIAPTGNTDVVIGGTSDLIPAGHLTGGSLGITGAYWKDVLAQRLQIYNNGTNTFNMDGAGSWTVGATRLTVASGGNVGIGTATPSAKLHSLATTEQLRIGYDASNYYSTTVGSTGGVTFDAVGAGALFTFSDDVRVTTAGTNTASVVTVGGTQTLTNKTLTSPVINVTSDATGDIYYRNSGGAFTRLPIGSTDNVLKVSGGLPSRGAPSGGGFWTTVPGTPTRSSDTVFTITDTSNANLYDQLLQRGTIIKRTQSGTKQAMVVSATYASNTVTVTLIGDTFAAGFSDVKYGLEKARMYKFAIAGTIGTTGTNLANTAMVECPIKLYGCDIWAGTAGSGTTTFDINKGGTTFFTSKPSITTTNQNILGTSADTGTTATTGDYLTLDVDAVAGTTKIIDAYVNLYYIPLYMANLT